MKIGASDGLIGHLKDFYFDEQSWMLRYIVADTGSWLPGRQVLLTHHAFAPDAFSSALTSDRVLHARLTRKQIEDSPSVDTHRPVSRQYEDDYHRYYGWPTYWQDAGLSGVAGIPAPTPPPAAAGPTRHGHNQRDDIHLFSTASVAGYQIQATDRPAGAVRSFMVDGKTWEIREISVDSGHWYSVRKILILPDNVERISYEDSTVYLNLSSEDILQTRNNEVAQACPGRP